MSNLTQSDINRITVSVLKGLGRSFTKARDTFARKGGMFGKTAVDIVGTCADSFNIVAKNIESTMEPSTEQTK